MARQKLSAEEIEKNLQNLKNWKLNGVKITKRFEFENFAKALDFVNQVSVLAEEADHHPDIKFGWGYAEFEITTHDAGGLTERDFNLAKGIDVLN